MNNTTLLITIAIFAFSIVATIWMFLRADAQKRKEEKTRQHADKILTNKLMAYERMTLLIERINPESLIIREQAGADTALSMHTLLLRSIRQEFEHNVAMQIYIEPKTWALILRAKEEIVKLINQTAKETDPKTPALVLGHSIIEDAPDKCGLYVRKALDAIRNDVNDLFQS